MAACLVILVLLAALVVFKCQAKRSKRRQLLRRSQPNEVVPMAQFQPRGGSGHSLGASSSTTTRPESSLALPRFPNSESSTRLGHAKSLQTMTTHLSDLELGSQGLSKDHPPLRGVRRVLRSPPPRIPDEDAVLPAMPEEGGGGYENRGMVLESPTIGTSAADEPSSPLSHLPPVQNGHLPKPPTTSNGKPYTISHSQVV